MSLLTIAQGVAVNVSIATPSAVIGNSDTSAELLIQFIHETGEELSRLHDWTGLLKAHTIAGTGAYATFTLPADYRRLQNGHAVNNVGGAPIRGSLAPAEWLVLPTTTGGVPRYFTITGGNKIAFYPYALTIQEMVVSYVTRNWIAGDKAAFTDDADDALLDDELLRLGAIWRWRRHTGNDFADHLAEYEAAHKRMAADDIRMRTGL